jgi:hypothetical protein
MSALNTGNITTCLRAAYVNISHRFFSNSEGAQAGTARPAARGDFCVRGVAVLWRAAGGANLLGQGGGNGENSKSVHELSVRKCIDLRYPVVAVEFIFPSDGAA